MLNLPAPWTADILNKEEKTVDRFRVGLEWHAPQVLRKL